MYLDGRALGADRGQTCEVSWAAWAGGPCRQDRDKGAMVLFLHLSTGFVLEGFGETQFQ